jgi:hypothetical protein
MRGSRPTRGLTPQATRKKIDIAGPSGQRISPETKLPVTSSEPTWAVSAASSNSANTLAFLLLQHGLPGHQILIARG